MEPGEEVCLCFHVTRRKVENFVRLERPQSASQLSECFGAGTGCGWCRPYLRRLFLAGRGGGRATERSEPLPTASDYARGRAAYVGRGEGQVPAGGTPAEPPSTGEPPHGDAE